MRVSEALAKVFLRHFSQGEVSECWIWYGPSDSDGVAVLSIQKRLIPASTISFGHFRYPLFEGMHLTRECGNTKCVNPYHLRVHFRKLGRRGEKNCNAVLEEDDIRRIRLEYDRKQGVSSIARTFGVGEGTVQDIIKRRTWKHVQ